MTSIFNWTKRITRLFTNYLSVILAVYLKRVMKWVFHKISGRSELERCILAKESSSKKIQKIEKCLAESRIEFLRKVVKVSNLVNETEQDDYAVQILKYKNIEIIHHAFLKEALSRIIYYNYFLNQIDSLRKTQFSHNDNEHRDYLIKLWNALKQEEPKSINDDTIGKEWVDLGFQSKDPSTDFRGMGLLSLMNLTYFTTNFKFEKFGKNVYLRSNHPLYGYSFAIVGINVTSWVHQWLNDGNLKTALFNTATMFGCKNDNDFKPIDLFNFIYCVIFMEFDRFWTVNEVEMLYFEQYAKLFRKCIIKKLGEKNFMFNSNTDDDVSNYYILKSTEIEKVSKFQCCTK